MCTSGCSPVRRHGVEHRGSLRSTRASHRGGRRRSGRVPARQRHVRPLGPVPARASRGRAAGRRGSAGVRAERARSRYARALPRRRRRVHRRGRRRAGTGDVRARRRLDGRDMGAVVRPRASRARSPARAARVGAAPDLIEALVAAGNDPIASAADLAELRAIISPFGFRGSMRVRADELRRLTVPTLLVWGDHDPVGAVEVAQATARLVRELELEVLPAGHAVWLGDPRRVSELLSRFVRSGSDG